MTPVLCERVAREIYSRRRDIMIRGSVNRGGSATHTPVSWSELSESTKAQDKEEARLLIGIHAFTAATEDATVQACIKALFP